LSGPSKAVRSLLSVDEFGVFRYSGLFIAILWVCMSELLPGNAKLVKMEFAFIDAIVHMSQSWMDTFKKIASDCGIPYLENRQGRSKHGPPIIEKWKGGSISRPGELLPGETENSPSHCFDVPKALDKLKGQRLRAMYFHGPSLCLVLVTDYDSIGIRSTTLRSGIIPLMTELYQRKRLRDSICVRAYEIWQENGCPEGADEQNWIEAEQQLDPQPSFDEWCIKENLQ